MHAIARSLVALGLLVFALPVEAQRQPWMKRSDDIVVETHVDSGRSKTRVSTPSAAANEGTTPAPTEFVPLGGLRSGTVPTTDQPPAGKPAEGPATQPTGGPAGIHWDTLWTVKPKAPDYDLPAWWTLVPKVEPPKVKAQKRTSEPANSQPGRGNDEASGGGEMQDRIVKAANSLVGKRFPYAPGTKGGVLGCANVVSAALKQAGVMKSIMLGVLAVNSDLRKRGFHSVKPPPWKDGDVISWMTYDRTGDGRKDPDTHIGIITVEGGTVYAINNSSSRRIPMKVPLRSMGYPVTTVLRHA